MGLPCGSFSKFAYYLTFINLMIVLVCCGGGSNTSSSGGPPSITSITVSGPTYTQANLCANFKATVSGSGNYDHSVTWSVDGAAGGTSVLGFIDNSGNYCAPVQPPPDNPVSIGAVANGDTSKSATTNTRIVAISITPTQAQMYTGQTQQFSATAGGGVSNLITWQVNGISGGNSTLGTVSLQGLYTAPSQFTNDGIFVDAALTEALSVYAGANVNLSSRIVISPQNPSLVYGNKQQFTATINGAAAEVNWAATRGTITPSGLYTATATQTPDTVRAWATNANGSTTVQIEGLKPTISGITPQPAMAIDQITIVGTNLNPIVTVVFSDAIGRPIPVSGASVVTNTSGTAVTVTVPQGSVSGPLYVITQQGTLAPVESNTLQFQRLARLRIHTTENDLSSGESVTLQYALLGDSTPHNVTFSADLGTFNGATYQAPGIVTTDTFAHIKGCITGTNSCDTLILGLHPFRISPDAPLVPIGQSLQLSAVLGNAVAGANWTLLNGGGSLNSNGLYEAGTNLISGGPALVSATMNGSSVRTQVGVTGAFSGLVNRIVEYFDQHHPDAPGTFADGVAVVGNRMYVSASNHLGGFTDSYFWIDIYDITDPLHPVWLTAVEGNSSGPVFASGQYLYSYEGTNAVIPGFPNKLVVYELQGQIPVLKAESPVPQWYDISNNGGILTLVSSSENVPPGSAEILIYDVTTGLISSRDLTVTLPADANTFVPDSAIAVGNRLFLSAETNDLTLGGHIVTYDLSTSPPTLLGTVEGRSLAFYASGNFLFGALGGMNTYDISGELPQFLSNVDGVNAAKLIGTQLLARTQQQGFRMFDFSNPQTPVQTAILFDGVIIGYDINQWVGDYVYQAEGDGGIAIFDTTKTGGPVVQSSIYGGPHLSVTANDLVWQNPTLYAATSTFDGAVLSVYDTSTSSINRVGEYVDFSQQGISVTSAGNYVYFGMTRNMAVLNVSQPASPSLVSTVPIVATCLEQAANTLFAGTVNKTLVVMNITNPAQPVKLSAVSLPNVPVRLRIYNNLLLIADGPGGLLIYDISSPTSPILLSRTTTFSGANDVAISGSTAFVAADVDGLGILSISNPAQPVLLSKTSSSRTDPFFNEIPLNQAWSIAISNGIVYVGTVNDNGMVFGIDCVNPGFPRILSKFAYGDFVLTSVIALLSNGNELLVAGSLDSTVFPIKQVDISQPFDSINEYFPPLALQSPAAMNPTVSARVNASLVTGLPAFHRSSKASGSRRLGITPTR